MTSIQTSEAITLATITPSLLGQKCVFRSVFVAFFAVCFLTLAISNIASTNVFLKSYGLQVLWIDTTSDPTQVVQLKSIGDYTTVGFIRKSMSHLEFGEGFDFSVPIFVCYSQPKPATAIGLRGDHTKHSFECGSIQSRHLIPFKSDCLGLREAGNFVAARFHFTPLLAANNSKIRRIITC